MRDWRGREGGREYLPGRVSVILFFLRSSSRREGRVRREGRTWEGEGGREGGGEGGLF